MIISFNMDSCFKYWEMAKIFFLYLFYLFLLQVFFSMALYLRACKIFDCVGSGRERGFVPKHGSKIDYELLAMGSLKEVRHVFARVVFDTIYPIDDRPQKWLFRYLNMWRRWKKWLTQFSTHRTSQEIKA